MRDELAARAGKSLQEYLRGMLIERAARGVIARARARVDATGVATRAWELRHNLSSYDASYVALAELTAATLVTLDRRLSRAPGLRCTVRLPQ